MELEQLSLLEGDIRRRLLRNRDNKDFVPYEWLVDLVKEDRIRKVLNETNIEDWDRASIVSTVRVNALRGFGTLVLMKKPQLIFNFIERDSTDGRLPMSKEAVLEVLGEPSLIKRREDLVKSPELKATTDNDQVRNLEAQIAPIQEWAGEFVKMQWIFLSPDFPQQPPHRMIFDSRPLPFLAPQTASSGSRGGHFGDVFEEKLPSPTFNDGAQKTRSLIRKELKSRGTKQYKDELRCLRLLNLTSHPNILELSGSYTYGGMHNFVFPVANLGDLHKLLEDIPPPAFLEDPGSKAESFVPKVREHVFYEAACGLASALEKLHYYSNDDLNLEMIGCHHDLKPRNVLVHESKFILADFGLSTLKKGPETMFRDRDIDFAAPEGRDLVTLERYPIGPPSDIWSLGCILAVILAYMKDGPTGVKDFENERKYTFPRLKGRLVTVYGFHGGRGRSNPHVVTWLGGKKANARSEGSHAEADLVELIQDMLTIDPSHRPEIRQVLRRLRCIALKKIAELIQKEFSASRHKDVLEFSVERHILLEWLDRVSPIAKADPQMLRTEESFSGLRRALHDIADELRLLSDVAENDRPLFTRLRHSNERLLASVEPAVQQSIYRRVELKVLHIEAKDRKGEEPGESHDPQDPLPQIDELQGTKAPSTPGPNYIRRVAIANMTRLMNESVNNSIPKLAEEAVEVLPLKLKKGGVPTFRLAKLRESSDEGAEARHVVVEEMLYNRNVADEKVARTLFDRMVHVLGVQNRPTADFRALRCRGFYHAANHHYFGLVYDFPTIGGPEAALASGQSTEVVQLSELINDHPDLVSSRNDLIITLDERYRLAHDLAAAVYAFHKVGWLHKNISSYNVIFFRDEGGGANQRPGDGSYGAGSGSGSKSGGAGKGEEPQVEYAAFSRLSLASPFLIGFSHGRPNEEGEYSNRTSGSTGGDEAAKTLRTYHHPRYYGSDSHRTPYRTAYDYHSLGLVLLEIGYWQPLRKLLYRGEKDFDRLQRTEHLRHRRIPGLAAYMGDVYAAAVVACLDDAALRGDVGYGGGNTGDRSSSGGDSHAERLGVDRNFERLVLTPLEALASGFRTDATQQGD